MNKIDKDTEEILNKFSLEQKIGQMICIGLNTTTIDPEFRQLISKYPFGSVGLYNRNIVSPQQVKLLTKEIQNIISPVCNGLNAMIALDQEGGVVSQFSSGITHTPGNMAIGATSSIEYSYNTNHISGLELSDMGITMNWAPVVDLNSNPQNEIIDVRSFSDNVELVSILGASAVHGLHCGGVGATAKHFPGHGNVSKLDTNLLVNKNTMEHVLKNDLAPFKHLARSSVDAIMVAPIAIPAFENEKLIPATLSKTMITGILRNEFNYDGVVMIDDLDHEAIINEYTLKKATQKALAAGADIFLLCHSMHHQTLAFNSLLNAVKKGTIKLERIDQSVRRIIKMKLKSLEYKKDRIFLDSMHKNSQIEKLCKDSIVLYSDQNKLIPINKAKFRNVLVVLPKLVSLAYADSSETLYCSLGEQLISEFDKIKVLTLPMSISKEQAESVIEEASNYDLVIIASENSNNFPGYLELINALNQKKPLIIVSLRHPYEISSLPLDATILVAFSQIDSSMEAIKNVITGRYSPRGLMPVAIKNPS